MRIPGIKIDLPDDLTEMQLNFLHKYVELGDAILAARAVWGPMRGSWVFRKSKTIYKIVQQIEYPMIERASSVEWQLTKLVEVAEMKAAKGGTAKINAIMAIRKIMGQQSQKVKRPKQPELPEALATRIKEASVN